MMKTTGSQSITYIMLKDDIASPQGTLRRESHASNTLIINKMPCRLLIADAVIAVLLFSLIINKQAFSPYMVF